MDHEKPASPSIWEKLAQLGRDAELEPCDLRADFAVNHDQYRRGLPKRQFPEPPGGPERPQP